MEPERPIEKLLRACARKRRDEAGPPFELHPATRRWLQGEVARRFGRLHPAPGRLGRSGRWFWPKLAWGLGVITVLAMALALLVPSLRHRPAETLLAGNKLALESPLARRPPAPAPEPAAPVVSSSPALATSKAESAVHANADGSIAGTTQLAGITGEQKRLLADDVSNQPNPSAPPPVSALESPAIAAAATPAPLVTNQLLLQATIRRDNRVQRRQSRGSTVRPRARRSRDARRAPETSCAGGNGAGFLPTRTIGSGGAHR